ncbi:MAG: hypothetical protein NWQ32_01890 [Paracoccaceae bacterium]|nr:hypothetical protein [Paracoccaceae bacterium]MDP5347126.1 hypothetical protein [Paracoccaceae bacterium]
MAVTNRLRPIPASRKKTFPVKQAMSSDPIVEDHFFKLALPMHSD